MQLLSVLNNTLKISYSPQGCDLFIGDMLEFLMPNNHGVVAQVFKLEMEQDENIAHLRIFFTIKDGNWIKWVGNIPPKSSAIKKIPEKEVMELFAQFEKNTVSVGFLPQYDRNFRVNIESLGKTFVLFDNNQNKVEVFENLKNEFVKSALPFVIFDFKGEFKSKNIPRINAIKDFKIPLNIETLLSMYEKNFQYSSPEMKLLFDDVISQIKVFFKKSEEVFIPFNIFKSVVDNAQPSIELSLLKNILEQYKEKELFANLKSDFIRLKSLFSKSTAYVVDMSLVPQEWQKDYILFVFSCLNKFFVLLEDNKMLKNSKEIDEIFESNKNIKLIGAINYSSEFLGEYVKRAKNLILCPPNKRINYFPNLVEYLSLLSQEEFIYQGEQSKYIPIMLQPPTDKECKKPITQSPKQISAEPKSEDVVFQKIKEPTLDDIPVKQEEIQEIISLDEDMIEFEEISLDDMDSLDDLEELSSSYDYNDEQPEEQEFEELELYEENKDDVLLDEALMADVESLYNEEVEQPQVIEEPKNPEPKAVEQESVSAPKPETVVPKKKPVYEKQEELKEYKVPPKEIKNRKKFEKEDVIIHPKYGRGVIKRIVSHGERNLYKIQFESNGIKLIDLDTIDVQKL